MRQADPSFAMVEGENVVAYVNAWVPGGIALGSPLIASGTPDPLVNVKNMAFDV